MLLVSYDIQDDRIRTQIAKTLIRHGLYRVQFSVFMGDLKERTSQKLWQNLVQWTNDKNWASTDTILRLPLHQYTEENLSILGKEPDFWIEIQGKLHTLIL
ncbi:MAG: CRISPR-associated endonuclease Cas2 [Bacteroidota bacterium]